MQRADKIQARHSFAFAIKRQKQQQQSDEESTLAVDKFGAKKYLDH